VVLCRHTERFIYFDGCCKSSTSKYSLQPPIDFENQMRHKNNTALRKRRCTLYCLSYCRDRLSSSVTIRVVVSFPVENLKRDFSGGRRFRPHLSLPVTMAADHYHTSRVSVARLFPARIPKHTIYSVRIGRKLRFTVIQRPKSTGATFAK